MPLQFSFGMLVAWRKLNVYLSRWLLVSDSEDGPPHDKCLAS